MHEFGYSEFNSICNFHASTGRRHLYKYNQAARESKQVVHTSLCSGPPPAFIYKLMSTVVYVSRSKYSLPDCGR